MGFRCGIVGLPNVGKSTLFNALTAAGALAANYPFATIDPNVGVAAVPDDRLRVLADILEPPRVVPTTVEFVDIAGLVAGASEGEGLGNQFLAHIRETQAIAHVVRCFDDPDVVHVAGTPDPAGDIDTVATELALADLATVERALERQGRRARAGEKAAGDAVAVLETVRGQLGDGFPVRALDPSPTSHPAVRELRLLTAKPVMYVANVDEPNGPGDAAGSGNPAVAAIAAHADLESAPVVVISGRLEAELAELEEDDRQELLADLGQDEPGLDRFVRAGHQLLGLGTFFTTNEKELRAWTLRHGMTAPEAAGVIHSDFERGFIKAEVVAYDDFVAHGGEQGARDAGVWRIEGKDYVVTEGDVVRFRFNV